MEINIAIASKGRIETQPALKMFLEAQLKPTLFVEPQEFVLYAQKWGEKVNIIDIGKNDLGLGYVRNFILDYYDEPFYMVDDDVNEISKRNPEFKLEALKGLDIQLALVAMLQLLVERGLAQLGVSFTPSNWMYAGSLRYFYRAWAIKLIDPKRVKERKIKFIEPKVLSLFEDYIFTLDLALAHLASATTFEYAFDCSSVMGKNKGGCQTYRDNDSSLEAAKWMQKKYGRNLVKIIWNDKHGQFEAQIAWNRLAKSVGGLISGIA